MRKTVIAATLLVVVAVTAVVLVVRAVTLMRGAFPNLRFGKAPLIN
ncbi:hypothetical protein G7043_37565 [Lentzea sp. NEAU-D13]|uniref:Uncharacterized protein n=1 Tax=Lentzea alba TaxID=2714351 RepID=A0A7C9VZF9_9PSEU|nr:hypothetical protein [Lentzea alba]NGY64636.1 hypothetical protein [Lentzea alba]